MASAEMQTSRSSWMPLVEHVPSAAWGYPDLSRDGTRDPGSRSGAAVVILEHEGGWMSAYRHMDDVELPLSLREGAPISRGDFIGLVGETGSPGQPHLHFEVGFGLQPGGSNAYDDPARLVS